MKKQNIWFVYVLYELTPKQRLECLRTAKFYPVVIIDNSDKELLRPLSVPYIRNKKNRGYAYGANQGMKYVFDHGAEWAVVCNQDITVSTRSLTFFCTRLRDMPPGIYGPEVGLLDKNHWTTKLQNRNTVCDYVSASFVAIHKDVIQRIGMFFEPYFMYYEDIDICFRARRVGFPVSYIPVEGFTHSLVKRPDRSFFHEYYLARNHLMFLNRFAPKEIKRKEYFRLPKRILRYVLSRNLGAIKGILNSVFHH